MPTPSFQQQERLRRPDEESNGGSVTLAPAKAPEPKQKRSWGTLIFLAIAGLLVLAVIFRLIQNHEAAASEGKAGMGGGQMPIPVVGGKVIRKDVPIYLDGLGTVQALNTVTVHARVDGQLEKVAFAEGQDVHAGDVLAQIDPEPFQAQLDQNQAKQNQDQAQLTNAQLDLKRYVDLLGKKVISQQQYDTQKALVDQLQATVRTDAAAVQSAKVQLDYATITSPLDGRTGIRLVDQGNIVHASDVSGLVVITQLQPISVVFTLPEQDLTRIHEQSPTGTDLTVLAVDRDNENVIDEGKVAVIDNQIDPTTGTIKLKATFPNAKFLLWPGQFINARLHLTTRKGGLVTPASVIQRGPTGPYAFIIKPDNTVAIQPVKVGEIDDGEALIDDGLTEGQPVVVDGQYKLQNGSHVAVPAQGGPAGHAHTASAAGEHELK